VSSINQSIDILSGISINPLYSIPFTGKTFDETLTLINGSKEPIELDVKIIADFSTIPERYHEIFLNIMASKYYNKASFGDNPFSKCLPPKKKKWWQFWN
jgi:hypothetical protein